MEYIKKRLVDIKPYENNPRINDDAVDDVAESIDQGSIIYRTWRLVKGHLEIVLVRDGANDVEELNIYDLVKLTADSLMYKDAEETFEYSRQKPKETYGEEVTLEDDSFDDFKM